MIHNLKTIEITMKKKEPNILTKTLTNYQCKKNPKTNINDVMMNFDATFLYPSAMWDKNSIYPKIETGFAFTPHENKT